MKQFRALNIALTSFFILFFNNLVSILRKISGTWCHFMCLVDSNDSLIIMDLLLDSKERWKFFFLLTSKILTVKSLYW